MRMVTVTTKHKDGGECHQFDMDDSMDRHALNRFVSACMSASRFQYYEFIKIEPETGQTVVSSSKVSETA